MKPPLLLMRPRDVALSLLVVVVWGVNFVALKIGVTYVPPIFLAALRFTAVTLMLLPFVPRPKRSDLPILFAIGFVFGGLHFATLFIGLTAADASVAAMVMQLGTPFSALFAWILLNDTFGWRRTLGLAIAFGGVALIVGFPSKETEFWAVMCLMVAASSWGLGNVLFKQADQLPFMTVMAWMSVCALFMLWPATLIFETGQGAALAVAPTDFWIAFGFMSAFSSVLAYGLWYRLITHYPVTVVVPFQLLAPVVGVISGVVLLAEPLNVFQIIGGLIVLGGVAIIQIRWRKPMSAGVGD